MGTANHDEADESRSPLCGNLRGDDGPPRMARDHPASRSTGCGKQTIQPPLECGVVGAAEGATPREFDDVPRKTCGARRTDERRVGHWIDQSAGEEDERGHAGARRLAWNEGC